jgi:hypothetical protein
MYSSSACCSLHPLMQPLAHTYIALPRTACWADVIEAHVLRECGGQCRLDLQQKILGPSQRNVNNSAAGSSLLTDPFSPYLGNKLDISAALDVSRIGAGPALQLGHHLETRHSQGTQSLPVTSQHPTGLAPGKITSHHLCSAPTSLLNMSHAADTGMHLEDQRCCSPESLPTRSCSVHRMKIVQLKRPYLVTMSCGKVRGWEGRESGHVSNPTAARDITHVYMTTSTGGSYLAKSSHHAHQHT